MWPAVTKLAIAWALLICLAEDRAAAEDTIAVARVIDRHIQARLDLEHVERAPQADDAEFLRRVYLDLHGVVPSADRVVAFLDSTDPNKQLELIEDLLASPRFGENFADIWRRRLMSPVEEAGKSDRFAQWMADQFNRNVGWDRVTYDLLTATGTVDQNPAVAYLIEGRHPRGVTDLADLASRHFLGIRLNCAQCHDHPQGKWTREDYWGMAAFFAQIQTPGRPKKVHVAGVQDDPRITLSTLAAADMLDGFLSRPPTFLGGEAAPTDAKTTNHRQALAAWITSAENPYFARATVNRMWWHFFGRGIVHPVDEMGSDNLASHPELLDELSWRFVASEFDLKFLCRAIVNSRTYQQTSRPGKGANPDRAAELFARMTIKVLSAEQLYDSLVEIVGPPTREKDRSGARREFVQFMADDADRDPTRYERGIPQLLRLMNSPQFAGKSLSALVSRIAASNRSADEVADELFLAILARRPTDAERQLVQDQLRDNRPIETTYRELAWALLLSSEFSLNH
jgi:hypothetical protein